MHPTFDLGLTQRTRLLHSRPNSFSDLRLIDFGLSRFFEPDTPMRTRVGTVYYTAPEVRVSPSANRNRLSDCSSLLLPPPSLIPLIPTTNPRTTLHDCRCGTKGMTKNATFSVPAPCYTSSYARTRRLMVRRTTKSFERFVVLPSDLRLVHGFQFFIPTRNLRSCGANLPSPKRIGGTSRTKPRSAQSPLLPQKKAASNIIHGVFLLVTPAPSVPSPRTLLKR